MMGIAGVILAGGRGQRMGGLDKASLRFGGGRLVDHVAARLGAQCAPIAISANGDAARFAGLGLPVLPDGLPDFPGPLAGILAAMDWASEIGAARALTVAVDTPFFPADLAVRLAASRAAAPALAASREDGRLVRHPTFGLWPVGLRDDLRHALSEGMRKVTLWADGHGAEVVEFPDEQAFFNINRAEDLARAQAILSEGAT